MKVLGVLALAMAAFLVLPQNAQASTQPHWDASSICVVSHVPQRWGVARAVKRWNKVAAGAPKMRLRQTCPGGADVTVRLGHEARGVTGASRSYQSSPTALRQVNVTLDAQHAAAYAQRGCMRHWTAAHELGHALGLEHYEHSHSGAVMSYLGWSHRCGRISAFDRSELRRLYR